VLSSYYYMGINWIQRVQLPTSGRPTAAADASAEPMAEPRVGLVGYHIIFAVVKTPYAVQL
jgi:hypothetical protein